MHLVGHSVIVDILIVDHTLISVGIKFSNLMSFESVLLRSVKLDTLTDLGDQFISSRWLSQHLFVLYLLFTLHFRLKLTHTVK